MHFYFISIILLNVTFQNAAREEEVCGSLFFLKLGM